jgi:hypothetical protein
MAKKLKKETIWFLNFLVPLNPSKAALVQLKPACAVGSEGDPLRITQGLISFFMQN